MKAFVGHDIRDVFIEDGPPVHAFDLNDKRRVFQFYWGGGTVSLPSSTTTYGTGHLIGNTVYTTSDSITTGGGTYTSKGCLISFITRWDEDKKGWIVEEYRYPDRLVC
jgi:hypothetical protein